MTRFWRKSPAAIAPTTGWLGPTPLLPAAETALPRAFHSPRPSMETERQPTTDGLDQSPGDHPHHDPIAVLDGPPRFKSP
jgi:hypothetical protein